ncbi:MAG TPA: ABC transporter ATP-binding protein [Spirochaetota bacterium]|nr:ABC transporter ATP-binding protein [Spirochaetota bacterium]
MEEIIYDLKDVKFSYNKQLVLNIGKLSFSKGKIYAMIGSNGSGKTTLMKILNGLINVNDGSVNYKNEAIEKNNFKLVRDETVYVHQNPYLFSGSVSYNLSYGLKLKKIDKDTISKKISETLKLIGMENFEARKNRELSIGEIQKIAIARAIVPDPDVLLLDEPTSNIDSKSIEIVEKLLLDLKSKNKTIIFSSHNSFFSFKLCDEIINLENGKIV